MINGGMENSVKFKGNSFECENKFLLSGDYPYYRDSVELWDRKLKMIKELGIEFITCYIPWIHHCYKKDSTVIYDFKGLRTENTNLHLFLKLIQDNNMHCIIKPGPFVHAELRNGGIPDFILDKNYKGILDQQGNPICYMGRILPNILEKDFKRDVEEWFEAVNNEIIKKYSYSSGSIVAIQIGNEGIYCNANSDLTSYDYSELGVASYKKFIEKQDGDTLLQKGIGDKPKSEGQETNTIGDEKSKIMHGKWSSNYLKEFYQEYSKVFMDNSLPKFANINAANSSQSLNSWIARIYPLKDRFYMGFTNWLKNVIDNPDDFLLLVITASIVRWPNIEDNWGHIWAGEEYKSEKIPLHHAILMLSRGSTGYNIYNICATQRIPKHLCFSNEEIERNAANPELFNGIYCEGAPVTDDCYITSKYVKLKEYVEFIKRNEKDLLHSKIVADFLIVFKPSDYAILAHNQENSSILYDTLKIIMDNSYDFYLCSFEDYNNNFPEKFRYILWIDELTSGSYEESHLPFEVTLLKKDETNGIYMYHEHKKIYNKNLINLLEKILKTDLKTTRKLVYTAVREYKKNGEFLFFSNFGDTNNEVSISTNNIKFQEMLKPKEGAVVKVENNKIIDKFYF